jgi:signal transduction histidine kinase
VVISSIVSSGKTYRPSGVVTLPSHTERIEIDYTALSFTIPERVLFRYKLEGIDSTWQDAGTRRQAYYTRLPPGQYRFRVLACNNDGIWNMAGDQVSIVITPAFYQTIWFRIAMTCIGCLAIWIVFRMRLRAATTLVESRLNDRLLERERIARDLHDTFFQGIQGLLLMINTAVNRLREEEPTRLVLKDALRRSDQVMAEGRQLVLDLRAESNAGAPLSDALALAGSEFKEVYAVPFSISVVGIPQELHPIVYEEMYRLAREAIWNSFQHANASSIEVQIVYEKNMFRLVVRDDGVGLDANVLSDGKRRHHWGLPGMRERAKKIGAVFTLRSSQNAGTEIEIKISAAVAYRGRPTRLWYGWARNCKDAD